jgi:hypothetical protein
MSDESNSNSKNGKPVGLVERIKSGVQEDFESLKTDLPAKAKEQLEGLKNPTKTQVFTSIFRHKHDDTPRNRALGVLSNVFLHLHPAKINRDAVRYSYTWGMGGITFYLRALQGHEASMVAPFFQSSPLFGATLAYLVLGETLTGQQLFGGALIISGVLSVSIGSGPKRERFRWKLAALLPAILVAAALRSPSVILTAFLATLVLLALAQLPRRLLTFRGAYSAYLVQREAAARVGRHLDLILSPCDVSVLAQAEPNSTTDRALADFLRRPAGDPNARLRLCLTPVMAEMIGTSGPIAVSGGAS